MAIGSRAAGWGDIEQVTGCIALAFAEDPIWSVALRGGHGGTDHVHRYWRLFVEGAQRYGTVSMTLGGEAVSVWLPPGGTELAEEQLAAFDGLVAGSMSPAGAAALRVLYERFEASRAARDPHAYLSLLATHPAHRGRGIGQALLANDLRTWDARGVPTYLESTNPANNHRYERAGYEAIGGFPAVLDDGWVTAMWRSVRPGS